MNTKAAVEDFLAQKTIALVGASRDPRKFSGMATKELTAKGYRIVPVNPLADTIGEERCYPDLSSIEEDVDTALVMVPKRETPKVIEDAAKAGIRRLWIQQGADSEKARALCEEKGISVVSGECIMMFAEPVGFGHRLHRFVWKLLGKLPS